MLLTLEMTWTDDCRHPQVVLWTSWGWLSPVGAEESPSVPSDMLGSPFPAWRCSRGYCERSRRSPAGSWRRSYCEDDKHHMNESLHPSARELVHVTHAQPPQSDTHVTIFLSRKYWSFLAPMTRRSDTSSLSIWMEGQLAPVRRRGISRSRNQTVGSIFCPNITMLSQ